ncbi:TetR family transcriptional regulator [Streptomyces sp. NPDC008150]|uniref:TetR/AcrR family transcriptional regulator n=1 Tax=Streptomyces sp. NPDC008150 TaxID=3364816 RepID=UPI0036E3EB9F
MTLMTAARITPPADHPRPGLRERKKIKTREGIRAAMYALVEEQGYDATTIEQIAERAEVSPSTVFRYFPTKEDIVLTDEWDPVMLAELRMRPADEPWPVSIRHVVREAIAVGIDEDLAVSRLRARLTAEVPAVRSRMMESMSVTGRMLCGVIAERTGGDPQSLEVRVYAMALVGALMETTLYWADHDHEDDLKELAERALDVLERGLPAAPGAPGGTAG